MKNKNYLLLLVTILFCCCNNVHYQDAANAGVPKAQNITWTHDGRTVTLSWQVADTTNMQGFQLTTNGKDPVEIDGVHTTYTIKHVLPNRDVLFTVKIRYRNGLISDGTTARVYIPYDQPMLAGFVLSAPSVAELPDDDEQAAAAWFENNYVKTGLGKFIPIAQMDQVNVDEVACIWIHIDRQGLTQGWQHLTGGFASVRFVDALRTYVEEGGRLFLSTHATQLIVAIGRVSDKYAPNQFASGQGGIGQDIWTINAYIGLTYDHRADMLYKQMLLGKYSGYEYTSFPMLSEGLREDHNCIWNTSDMTFTTGSDKVRGFEMATNCTVLGTWGQSTEFTYPGFCRFDVSGQYRAPIITMGLGCYEWNKEGGNAFQQQIETLTRNIIEYLRNE